MNRSMVSRNAPLAAILAAALAASCAAPLRIQASLDPLALLSKDRLAYVRVSGAAARDLAPALLSPERLGQARGLLDRTRVIALCLGRAPNPSAGFAPDQAAASPNASGAAGLEAVLVGDYPFRAASLSLGTNREWRREKDSFYNQRLGIRATVPGPNLVVAAQGSIEGLLAAARSSATSVPLSPIPQRLEQLSSREQLVLWIPDPFRALAGRPEDEGMNVPARGLLVAASPDLAKKGGYLATIAFLMDSPDAVKVFKPVLRLGWYALSSAAFGPEAGPIAKPSFEARGELYAAEGVRLTRESLVFAVGRLGGIGGDGGIGTGAKGGPGR